MKGSEILFNDNSFLNFKDKVLPFWKNMLDEENGGFYGFMDINLAVEKKAKKFCSINSEYLLFFSKSFLIYSDGESLFYMKKAYTFFLNHFLDKEYGGVFSVANFSGDIISTNKKLSDFALSIHALSLYYEATEDVEALKIAFELFQLTESMFKDDIGYMHVMSRDFHPVHEKNALENGGVSSFRNFSSMLNLLESYTELYRLSGDDWVGSALLELVDLILHKVYNEKNQVFYDYFDYNLEPIMDFQSYGNGFKAVRCLFFASSVLENPTLSKKIKEILRNYLPNLVRRSVSKEGVKNSRIGNLNDRSRLWWIQAEAVSSLLISHQNLKDNLYLDIALQLIDYIENHFEDKRPLGEWYHSLDEFSEVIHNKPIANFEKGPYSACLYYLENSKNTI